MDLPGYIHKRKRRYMAQVLERFEKNILPALPQDDTTRKKTEDFKALVRMRMNALAVDAVDAVTNPGHLNGASQDLRDRLHPEGRP